MRRIAIVNAKGGTGKTTCTVNLAAALGEQGTRVLVVDLDPQGGACDGLGVLHAPQPGKDLRDIVDGGVPAAALPRLICRTSVPNVAVIPASPRLEGLSLSDVGGVGRARILHLRTALEAVAEAGEWDVVLLDTAPTIGPGSLAALAAATEALVPLNPSPAALPGLQTVREAIKRVRVSANPMLALRGVLLCRVRRTRLAGEIAMRLQSALPGLVFSTTIRESVRVEEAHGWSRPVLEYAPRAPIAADFRALAAEVLAQGENGMEMEDAYADAFDRGTRVAR